MIATVADGCVNRKSNPVFVDHQSAASDNNESITDCATGIAGCPTGNSDDVSYIFATTTSNGCVTTVPAATADAAPGTGVAEAVTGVDSRPTPAAITRQTRPTITGIPEWCLAATVRWRRPGSVGDSVAWLIGRVVNVLRVVPLLPVG